MSHPDIPYEAAYLSDARRAMAAMAARTTAALDTAESAATDADSEVARWHLQRRLDSFDDRDELVAFGRIDEARDRWYVGRRHIEDEAGSPLVVDWRAPVAIPFYRATVHDQFGLDRRRRFIADGSALVDILEEDFTDPDSGGLTGGIPDPLLVELDRERSGTMRDIVATIAAEQDEVIRAPLERLLIVQGGPGTGKTAVALHRVAYLLFEHRLTLSEGGVLVIGPNPVFLRYVADVLPSLGETDVRQTTISGLRPPSVRLGDDDSRARGRLLGDRRMAEVIRAAIRDLITIPSEPVSVATTWGTVRVEPEVADAAVKEILARDTSHANGKEALRSQLLHWAYAEHERVSEVPALKANFVAAARSHPEFRKLVDRIWPVPPAASVVARMFSNGRARARATAGVLNPDEVDLLARPTASRVTDERWHPSEVPLIDEAEAQLSGVRQTYGHVVVDEAQDLSDMALRMLARRAPSGSMTIVGDLAQGTRGWAQHSWEDVEAVLSGQAGATRSTAAEVAVQRAELTVGYRTPAPMLDFANRLLSRAAPGVRPARSIRRTGREPEVVHTEDVVAAVVAATSGLSTEPGTLAVIAADYDHEELVLRLTASGIDWGAGTEGLGRVALLTPLLAKGLEFDHVVVAEPADIVDAEEAGYRALFVALTRATQTLVVVHARPLPPELT